MSTVCIHEFMEDLSIFPRDLLLLLQIYVHPQLAQAQNGSGNSRSSSSLANAGTKSLFECRHRKDNGFHLLYKICPLPLDLLHLSEAFCTSFPEAINDCDYQGNTPLYWLILHANRGLSHHRCQVVSMLKDLNICGYFEKGEYRRHLVQLDAAYQEQVRDSIALLLKRGADLSALPSYVPLLAHDSRWNEVFKRIFFMTGRRWLILDSGHGIEETTYSSFECLRSQRVKNTLGLTLFHMAAWKGDLGVMQTLAQNYQFAEEKSKATKDERNAFHLLYHYCLNVSELSNVTEFLLQQGISPFVQDQHHFTPLHYLIRHVMVKGHYYAKLGTRQLVEDISEPSSSQGSSFSPCHPQVLRSLQMLLDVYRDSGKLDMVNDLLFFLLDAHVGIFQACDQEVQSRNISCAPFCFSLWPLTETTRLLLTYNIPVNYYGPSGRNVLHLFVDLWCLVDMDNHKASLPDMTDYLQLLLEAGAQCDPTRGCCNLLTPLQSLTQLAITTMRKVPLQEYFPAMQQLYLHSQHRGRLLTNNVTSVLYVFCQTVAQYQYSLHRYLGPVCRLLQLLLQFGAYPETESYGGTVAASYLLLLPDAEISPSLTVLLVMLLSASPPAHVHQWMASHRQYFHKIPNEEMVLSSFSKPRSLMSLCRFTVWRVMGHRFYQGCRTLPLPHLLHDYLMELVPVPSLEGIPVRQGTSSHWAALLQGDART